MQHNLVKFFIITILFSVPTFFVFAQDGSVPPGDSDPVVEPTPQESVSEPVNPDSVIEPKVGPVPQLPATVTPTSDTATPTQTSVTNPQPATSATSSSSPVIVNNQQAITTQTPPVGESLILPITEPTENTDSVNSSSLLYLIVLAIAIPLAGLGVFSVVVNNTKKKVKSVDRCQLIKQQLEQKKIGLKTTTQALSAQQIIIDSLNKKIEDKKNELKDAAKKKVIQKVKHQIKLTDDNLVGRGVATVESGIELFESLQEKLEQAKKTYTALQAQQTKLMHGVKELEAAYAACMAGLPYQEAGGEVGLEITLPSQTQTTKYILHGGNTSKSHSLNDQFFKSIVANLPAGGKVLLVCFARPESEYQMLYARDKQSFERVAGKKKVEVILATRENFAQEIKKSDAIYLLGGDTLQLLETLKQYPEFGEVTQNKVVAGSSAGAYILSTNYYSNSLSGVFPGLGILPINVVCHFDGNQRAIDELKRKSPRLRMVVLKDCESIIISGY